MMMRLPGRPAVWNLWWDAGAMSPQRRGAWVKWLNRLCRELPPYYVSGCATQEYEAKHLVVESRGAATVTGTAGVSAADFQRFLPGVYWLTIFGPDLARHFGSRLDSVPHATTIRHDPTHVTVLVDGPVVPDDLPERLRVEREIGDFLGGRHFFDRTRPTATLVPVPTLAATLRRADRPSG